MGSKAFVVVGAVVGAVALASGSAVAATVITSSNIKDGTILAQDINSTFRATIVNPVPKYYTKTVETTGTNPSASILCPTGTRPISGGYRIGGWADPSSVLVTIWNGLHTNSSGVPVGWKVQFHSEQYQDMTIGVQVLCQKK